jgi:hypothetical protein
VKNSSAGCKTVKLPFNQPFWGDFDFSAAAYNFPRQHYTECDAHYVVLTCSFVCPQQELKQKVYILKNELTPQEKAAMQDMRFSLQQAWALRGIKLLSLKNVNNF